MPVYLQSCFLHSLCKPWDSVLELRDFDLVSMTRFGFDNSAIVHLGDGIGVMKYTGIMCYDDYGPIGMDSIFGEQFHHGFAGRVIKRCGWLIAQNQPRLMDECAGEGDALLFAAGELVRQGVESIAHPELAQNRLRLIDSFSSANSGGEQGNGGVLCSRQRR
jgi:hypothetical protein